VKSRELIDIFEEQTDTLASSSARERLALRTELALRVFHWKIRRAISVLWRIPT
jgi:hypothetical protein